MPDSYFATTQMPQAANHQALAEMIAYYRARAGEYDQWFYRQGRYDRGDVNNARWFAETAEVSAALAQFLLQGDILELACGTGIWTERLNKTASKITAVDASPEVIEINRHKVRSDRVEYIEADLFEWQPPRQFDAVFFGFWMSHVPADRLGAFWKTVGIALKPGGKVFFVDSRRTPTSTAVDHQLPADGELQVRKLDDGRKFQIVKIYYEPDRVATVAASAGIKLDVRQTSEYFLYGYGTRDAH